ncbi:MAG: SGNH/GDSL hydrolase family protein [Verrucomicrobiia bacterium]|jgi:lysophospholipase L1-like esterase
MKKLPSVLALSLFMSSTVFSQTAPGGELMVSKGDKVAFLGDSITAAGRRAGGYCHLVITELNKQGLAVTPVYAGIGGHKSNQMLARLEKDVLSQKPNWMTLSCGVNDVWHGARGVPLDAYQKNITEIVTRAQAAGVQVMLLTSTMIHEDQVNANNQKLVAYNAFLKTLAREKKCLFADLNTDMQNALTTFPKSARKGKQLTSDGVHMNGLGNHMMAKGVLRAFGVTDKQLAASTEEWRQIPNTENIRLNVALSLAEAEEIAAIAAKENKSVSALFNAFLAEKKKALLKK